MKLSLVKQGDFLGTKCDFYVDEDKNIYMSRTQIGYGIDKKNHVADPEKMKRKIDQYFE